MKRWIWRALVFLLIGAVINVAVAWGCAAWSPLGPAAQWPAGWPTDHHWPVAIQEDWPDPPDGLDQYVYAGFGLRFLDAFFQHTMDSANPGSSQFDDRLWIAARIDAGWPFRSFTAHMASFEASRSERLFSINHKWVHGIKWHAVRSRPYTKGIPVPLPYGPLYLGCVVNTVFWGALIGALVVGIPSARHAYRQRRSLCPACGYPLGTSPICTECGKPVKPRAAASA